MHDIFFFTDVHGCYDLYRAAMKYCIQQDPECTIIFGGDACDRGPDGYRIMKELLNNPQVIYLKGNHEDIFVKAAYFILNEYRGDINEGNIIDFLYMCNESDTYGDEIKLSIYNGGYDTLSKWMLSGMPADSVHRIAALPITFSYEALDFCHAGGTYNSFQRVARDEYDEQLILNDDLMMTIWDRNHLGQGWAPDRTCIFGHTPVMYLPSKYYGKDKSLVNAHPCAYYGTLDNKWTGRKIDMDTAAVASGKLYVLNCLTMEAQGFYDIDFAKEQFDNHRIEKIEVIRF